MEREKLKDLPTQLFFFEKDWRGRSPYRNLLKRGTVKLYKETKSRKKEKERGKKEKNTEAKKKRETDREKQTGRRKLQGGIKIQANYPKLKA